MLRALTIGMAIVAACIVATTPCSAMEFITNGQGGYLVDDAGGRIAVLSDDTHSVVCVSSWPSQLEIPRMSVFAQVKSDLSGIDVVGFASGSKVVKTEIVTVDSSSQVKTLATCMTQRCDFSIAKIAMHPASNDVWVLATTVSGKIYATTTKMSPP